MEENNNFLSSSAMVGPIRENCKTFLRGAQEFLDPFSGNIHLSAPSMAFNPPIYSGILTWDADITAGHGGPIKYCYLAWGVIGIVDLRHGAFSSGSRWVI